jgi:hypothetical protein
MQAKSITAVSICAALVAVTIMALVTRIFLARAKHTTTEDKYTTENKLEEAQQLAQISKSWKRVFTAKQEQDRRHWVPSFSSIIKAGDEGLFTTALFANLHAHPDESILEALYDAFANELRSRPTTGRSLYPEDMTKFLTWNERPMGGIGRSKPASHTRRTEVNPQTHTKSMDISVMEMGLVRGLSVKRPAAVLIPIRNGLLDEVGHKTIQSWIQDGQPAKYPDRKMTVRITPTELAALSILLGSRIPIPSSSQESSTDTGAYGISFSLHPSETGKTTTITLHPHQLSISQHHASGSCISPLYAKHLFCGSLPYSQDNLGVHSILINDETFEAIQFGASLSTHAYLVRSPASKYLEALPSAREVRFHILATDMAAEGEMEKESMWLDAIAALPFSGGLVPVAAASLIKTVQFVASAGLQPARLLQRLEGLVDKVHRHSPHLYIFGPLYEAQHAGLLYRERERLGKLANERRVEDTLADKTARMSRYITLLERLMALVPDTQPHKVLDAVHEATKLELRKSCTAAVTAHVFAPETTPHLDSKRLSVSSRPNPSPTPPRFNRPSLTFNSSPATSGEFPVENLAKQLEHVLKSDLPFDVRTIAFVARMVIVAWTLSVESVEWEGGGEEKASRWVQDLERIGGWESMVIL